MNGVILIGAFSTSFELCEECGLNIIGYVDIIDYENKFPYKYLGNDNDFADKIKYLPNVKYIVTPDLPVVRKQIVSLYKPRGCVFTNLISPNAKLSKTASLSESVTVNYGALIKSDSLLGQFVKIGTHVNVGHDSKVMDFSTVAPDAVILGRVSIGAECYIGANSTILPEINITNNVTIGAGAVVTKDIVEPGTYVGIPAKRMI